MKKLLIPICAVLFAIGSAFVTNANQSKTNQTGYVQSSGSTCVSDITVLCHDAAAQDCTIAGTEYFRNASCQFLTKD